MQIPVKVKRCHPDAKLPVYSTDGAAGNDLLISAGDRVCQGVLMPAPRAQFIDTDELSETSRDSNGFGSTGR